MSAPLTPADYFIPVLASARLHNELKGDLTADELRQKVVENLRVNFLQLFQSATLADISEPTSLKPSIDNVQMATLLISRLHEKYEDMINRPHLFDYYLEEDDLALAEKFRTGEALKFLKETLTPYLADLADRGICSEQVLEEKYSEFLRMMRNKPNIAAEEFWDSPAVMMYSSHMAYRSAAEQLRLANNNMPVAWYENGEINDTNHIAESEELTESDSHRPHF